MVKLHGPLHSVAASGSIADALTFSNWKGRSYAKQKTSPADPKSASQVSFRAIFKFLTEQWQLLSNADQITWSNLAIANSIAPFHAYCGDNLDAWRSYLAPTKQYPAARAASGSDTWWTSAVWIKNRICFTTFKNITHSAWGIAFYGSTSTGFTPGTENTILVVQDPLGGASKTYWTPPTRTTWYLRFSTFSIDGKLMPAQPEETAIPP